MELYVEKNCDLCKEVIEEEEKLPTWAEKRIFLFAFFGSLVVTIIAAIALSGIIRMHYANGFKLPITLPQTLPVKFDTNTFLLILCAVFLWFILFLANVNLKSGLSYVHRLIFGEWRELLVYPRELHWHRLTQRHVQWVMDARRELPIYSISYLLGAVFTRWFMKEFISASGRGSWTPIARKGGELILLEDNSTRATVPFFVGPLMSGRRYSPYALLPYYYPSVHTAWAAAVKETREHHESRIILELLRTAAVENPDTFGRSKHGQLVREFTDPERLPELSGAVLNELRREAGVKLQLHRETHPPTKKV